MKTLIIFTILILLNTLSYGETIEKNFNNLPEQDRAKINVPSSNEFGGEFYSPQFSKTFNELPPIMPYTKEQRKVMLELGW